MISIDEVQEKVRKGVEIESILKEINWQEFETFVAKIFQQNDFLTVENFRFKTKRRYEIDIVAIRNNTIFCVDCKQWGRGRYKSSAIFESAKKQNKRCREFKKFIKFSPLIQNKMKIDYKNSVISPLIVTLFEEDLINVENVYIIPIWKLNNFLIEHDNF